MFSLKHRKLKKVDRFRGFSHTTNVLVTSKDGYMIKEERKYKVSVMKMLIASCEHTFLRGLVRLWVMLLRIC